MTAADLATPRPGEPTTEAGRRLLAREAYNERSFALITAEAILAVETEARAASQPVSSEGLDVRKWLTAIHNHDWECTGGGHNAGGGPASGDSCEECDHIAAVLAAASTPAATPREEDGTRE